MDVKHLAIRLLVQKRRNRRLSLFVMLQWHNGPADIRSYGQARTDFAHVKILNPIETTSVGGLDLSWKNRISHVWIWGLRKHIFYVNLFYDCCLISCKYLFLMEEKMGRHSGAVVFHWCLTARRVCVRYPDPPGACVGFACSPPF